MNLPVDPATIDFIAVTVVGPLTWHTVEWVVDQMPLPLDVYGHKQSKRILDAVMSFVPSVWKTTYENSINFIEVPRMPKGVLLFAVMDPESTLPVERRYGVIKGFDTAQQNYSRFV